MDEFKEFYPNFQVLVDFTAAARVNGYIGSFGMPIPLPGK